LAGIRYRRRCLLRTPTVATEQTVETTPAKTPGDVDVGCCVPPLWLHPVLAGGAARNDGAAVAASLANAVDSMVAEGKQASRHGIRKS